MAKKITIKPIHIFIIAPIVLALSFFIINHRNNILKEAMAAPKMLHPLTFYCDLDEDLVNFTKENMEMAIYQLEMEKYLSIGAPPGGGLPPIEPPPPSAGFFSLPMNNACVTCPYEGYKYPGTNNCHEGTDYGAVKGSPVFNVAHGIIKGWGSCNRYYGNWVAIEHSYTLPGNPGVTKLISFYAHLLEGASSEVQSIGVGGVIGKGIYLGREGGDPKDACQGGSTGPHLHFALLTTMEINGQEPWPRYIYSVNPEEYLPLAGQCVVPYCSGCH